MSFLAKGSWSRRILVGGVASTVVLGGGAGLVYRRRLKENRSVTAVDFNAAQDQRELKIAFENLYAEKKSTDRPIVRLYRYTTCPFCGTAKAFLDYYKIEHELVEVEPMFKGELKYIDYKKVPNLQFLVTGHWGPFLADSEIIVSTLAKYVGAEKQLTDPAVNQWRQWSRNELVRFLVLNINSSLTEAWRGYDYIDRFDTIPTANKIFLKVMGAPVMFLVAKMMTKPALIRAGHMKEGDDVRARLMEELNKFTSEALVASGGKKAKLFHGGAKPDLADIDAYGVLQSVRGHRIYNDIIASTTIQPWLDRMDQLTGKDVYVVPPTAGQ